MRTITILSFLVLLLIFAGCTSAENTSKNPDETGQHVIIGYVNTDAFYLVSIEKRMNDVLDWLRSERSIFFQPSPDDLLKLADVCLKREIRKTGLKQPGMTIDKDEKNKIAIEMSTEKGDQIVERLIAGENLEDISNDLGFKAPKKSQKVHKDDNPEYDDDVFGNKDKSIIGPIIGDDRLLIFIIKERGFESNGTEWADILPVNIGFPTDDAQRILEDRLAVTWNVRITNEFYSAIAKYYAGDFEGTWKDIQEYVKKDGRENPLAYFLVYKVLIAKKLKKMDDSVLRQSAEALEKAAKLSKDPKLTPYFNLYLGDDLLTVGENEKAGQAFRAAFDGLHSDIFLTEKLLGIFEAIGDTEYAEKASKKKVELEAQIKEELAMRPRKPKSKEVIMTGEGPLREDPEAIWKEKETDEKKNNDKEKD